MGGCRHSKHKRISELKLNSNLRLNENFIKVSRVGTICMIDDKNISDIYQSTQKKYLFDHYKPDKYMLMRLPDINICVFMTKYVGQNLVWQLCDFITGIFNSIKKTHRCIFDKFQVYFISSDDLDVLNASSPGQKNAGGAGFLIINIDTICAYRMEPNYITDQPVHRLWDIPLHEFGLAVEMTLGISDEVAEYYERHIEKFNHDKSPHYFAWSTEKWFGNYLGFIYSRGRMAKWEYEYLCEYYEEDYEYVPRLLIR